MSWRSGVTRGARWCGGMSLRCILPHRITCRWIEQIFQESGSNSAPNFHFPRKILPQKGKERKKNKIKSDATTINTLKLNSTHHHQIQMLLVSLEESTTTTATTFGLVFLLVAPRCRERLAWIGWGWGPRCRALERTVPPSALASGTSRRTAWLAFFCTSLRRRFATWPASTAPFAALPPPTPSGKPSCHLTTNTFSIYSLLNATRICPRRTFLPSSLGRYRLMTATR